MAGGELYDHIIDTYDTEQSNYTEENAARIMHQLVDVTAYLHNRGIVHRDLKPENMLFESRHPESPIKIIDFGLARHFRVKQGTSHSTDKPKGGGYDVGASGKRDKRGWSSIHTPDGYETQMMRTQCGSPAYCAPEICKGRDYNELVDVWSLGVIMYVLLSGVPPFYDDDSHDMESMIKSGDYTFEPPYESTWPDVTTGAKELIASALETDPKRRVNINDFLKNHWLYNNTRKSLQITQRLAQIQRSKRNWRKAFQAIRFSLMVRRCLRPLLHLLFLFFNFLCAFLRALAIDSDKQNDRWRCVCRAEACRGRARGGEIGEPP